jgi:hypothetical protein
LEKDFPDWNNLYNTQNVETMPWYNEQLDSDLEEELERRKVSKGRILDLGTCTLDSIRKTIRIQTASWSNRKSICDNYCRY